MLSHAAAPHGEFDLSAFTGKWQELHAQVWAHIQASAEETRALIEELLASAKAAHSEGSWKHGADRKLSAVGDHDFSAAIQDAIDRFNAYVDELFAKVSEHKTEWSSSWSAAHDGAEYDWGFDVDGMFADWKAEADELKASFSERLDSHTWGSWKHGADRKLSALGEHEYTLPSWISSWETHDWSEKAAEWTAHFDAATLSWSEHVEDAIADWESKTWTFDWPEHSFDFDHDFNFDFDHEFEIGGWSDKDWSFDGFEMPSFDHDFDHDFDFDPDFDFDFDHGSWADKFNTRKLSMFAHAAAPHGEFDL
eukprot:CAMPEP_0182606878 /NCGR_PEP_ID=MMETSP1330-20130603/1665_1 /TAXON_ID=464278 /ORGANISM="Picochlorum sp., Strain RCC944" /LENGTH=307 /DNA_ID=CAMNT_0024825345 /DNA_START=385 /DNA_END=1305 /DNA_ORIENTATION=-